MKKQLTKESIFRRRFNGCRIVRVKDFEVDLQPDDIIEIDYVDIHESDGDDYTVIEVLRERMQTDEELEELKRFLDQKREKRKQQRREEYLKLKKEFENE